ncbi:MULTISPECIES: LexA family protein [unclassified Pseudoclavibacter]|uniref:LexA family protein n=1 Tax=unclassified Pseudoclavibacter TaxID=2615177 RepID=UPI001CE445FA|nr:translesion error-prone DNA polymerase V autoproteolytic subunit [Pseudoclavibacter sp. CFCC 13796]MCD7100561.1 translesion error-prone DNA polymerase V autoproteolytic subunit [Pseudoclavibacter sp. 13-3]
MAKIEPHGRVTVLAALSPVHAGFPSPAQDYFDGSIDLNEHLIADPVATFIIRVAGDSMIGCGISDGDEVIVDRSLRPVDGSIVIAVVEGELTIKRLRLTGRGPQLHPENPDYPVIHIGEGQELSVWGVVTRCLHRV